MPTEKDALLNEINITENDVEYLCHLPRTEENLAKVRELMQKAMELKKKFADLV